MMEEKTVLTNNSKALQDLFAINNYSEIKRCSSSSSICNSLLTAINIDNLLYKIQSLSKNVEIKRELPSENERVESGAVYTYEVDVVRVKNRLCISERDSSKRFQFFSNNQLRKAARVIWIHSKDIRVIDAKLCAYKDFENHIKGNKNVLLHHDFDDHDEIFKLSGMQKFESLVEIISSIKEDVDKSIEFLKGILRNAAEKAWTQENVRRTCYEADLEYDSQYVGRCESKNYVCSYYSTVKKIKGILLKTSFESLTKSFGLNTFEEFSNYLHEKLTAHLKHDVPDIQLDVISSAVHSVMAAVVGPLVENNLYNLGDLILDILQTLTLMFWSEPVDVNSKKWRTEVADEIYEQIDKNQSSILSNVFDKIRDIIIRQAKQDLETVSRRICEHKNRIAFNQDALISEWRKREVGFEGMNCPSLLTYIAGEKDGNTVVKVFLSHDDKKAQDDILKRCRFSKRCEFVSVTEKYEQNQKATRTKELKTTTASSIDIKTRTEMNRLIKNHRERLMANHSTIIAIGIDRGIVNRDALGAPCIVLHCLDKTLIPFGEKKIPDFLEGYPVELRED